MTPDDKKQRRDRIGGGTARSSAAANVIESAKKQIQSRREHTSRVVEGHGACASRIVLYQGPIDQYPAKAVRDFEQILGNIRPIDRHFISMSVLIRLDATSTFQSSVPASRVLTDPDFEVGRCICQEIGSGFNSRRVPV
jgi:hypothetical protein